MNKWIFICLIIIIIAIANPFLMDYITHTTSDVYVNQLKDNANPLEVKNSSKILGLVYLAEAIIIFILILFMRKKKNKDAKSL